MAWVIHAIYAGAPFGYKLNNAAIVKRIKLSRCNGGIVVDGKPYAFERAEVDASLPEAVSNEPLQNPASVALLTLATDLQPALDELQTMFTETRHLFLSDNDRKVVKKTLSRCENRMKELEAKCHNAAQLL